MTHKPDRVNRFWADARKRILERNKYGHAPNDAGPVSMGFRLNTEKNFAYSTIVYEKGAFVLHMLQEMMYDKNEGDKPFIAMMHQFVEQYRNRNATTEDFQKVAEKYVTPHTDLAGNGKLGTYGQIQMPVPKEREFLESHFATLARIRRRTPPGRRAAERRRSGQRLHVIHAGR